jgi:hypothetical protein
MAIHRFKCSPDLNEEIQSFSRKYMFNNDADLLDNFEEWYTKPNIVSLVNIEEGILTQHDYDVPIKQKIYRSIKYYYIKKFIKNEDTKPKERTTFIKIAPEIMDAIKEDLTSRFKRDPTFKPAESYKLFQTTEDPNIKKSYKNQYYQMKKKLYPNNVHVPA